MFVGRLASSAEALSSGALGDHGRPWLPQGLRLEESLGNTGRLLEERVLATAAAARAAVVLFPFLKDWHGSRSSRTPFWSVPARSRSRSTCWSQATRASPPLGAPMERPRAVRQMGPPGSQRTGSLCLAGSWDWRTKGLLSWCLQAGRERGHWEPLPEPIARITHAPSEQTTVSGRTTATIRNPAAEMLNRTAHIFFRNGVCMLGTRNLGVREHRAISPISEGLEARGIGLDRARRVVPSRHKPDNGDVRAAWPPP